MLARQLPNVAVVVFDHQLRVLVAEGEALLSHGVRDHDAEGELLSEVMEGRAFADLEQPYLDSLNGQRSEFQQLSPNGERCFHISVKPMVDAHGTVWAGLALAQDITGLRATERTLLQRTAALTAIVHQDDLTGLPNRAHFRDRLQRALDRGQRDGRMVGLLFVDLDRFKSVNDGFGHEAGDHVLRQVAQVLLSATRATDTVARLGGDEFVVVVEGMRDGTEALAAVERIFAALRAPVAVLDTELMVSASVGVALAPQDGATVDALLAAADRAMYGAKPVGNHHRFFDPRMHERALQRRTIEMELHHALRRDELVLHYQPAVDLRTGQVRSVEALVRWNHPRRGLLAPDVFIPVAERAGMAGQITEWVLQRACLQARRWLDAGLPSQRIAVNSCSRELDGGLSDLIGDAISRTGIAPERLEIEVTERFLGEDDAVRDEMLQELKRLGVSIALDDFGTGYSSLARLRSFPVDVIKIDRTFVGELPEAPAIAQSIIVLAHNLGVQVIAEGVEDERQSAWLKATTCDAASGFFICRPQPAGDLTDWLVERTRTG